MWVDLNVKSPEETVAALDRAKEYRVKVNGSWVRAWFSEVTGEWNSAGALLIYDLRLGSPLQVRESQPQESVHPCEVGRTIPPYPGLKGRTYFCRDSDRNWAYLNDSGHWVLCPDMTSPATGDQDKFGTSLPVGEKEGPEQGEADDVQEAQVSLTCGLPDLVIAMVGCEMPDRFTYDGDLYEIRKIGPSVPTTAVNSEGRGE